MTLIAWIMNFFRGIVADVLSAAMDKPGSTTTVINSAGSELPPTPVDQVLERYEGI